MSGIFVNYRHGPHSVSVAALADRLAAHFGPDQVFVDHHMRSGSRYPDELRAKLKAADVLVAVIHTGWVDTFDREPPDWVRWEIETALGDGKEVVPLLLEDTPPPTRADLPPDIGELALRQVAYVRAAHLPEDVDRLLRRLEEWVPPPDPPEPPRRSAKRLPTWLRATPLAAGAALLPFGLAMAADNDWVSYLTAALMSLAVMFWTAVVFFLQLLASNIGTKQERRTSALPYRQFVRNHWAVFAVLAVTMAIALFEFARQGGTWRFYATPFLAVLLAYYLERMLRREIEYDKEWPPPPSVERHHIRRTVTRLHETLTTPQAPYPYRSRRQQQQVVQVYLDLAAAKLSLAARRDLRWRPWLTAGHSIAPIVFSAWIASIAGLLVTGSVMHPSPSSRLYLADAVLVLIAVVLAAIGVWLDRLAKRRTDGQVVDELAKWQQTLGPLVFIRDRDHTDAR